MERLRSFIRSAFSYPRKLYATHPVTTVSIIAATVLYAIHNYLTLGVNDIEKKIGKVPMDIFFHLCIAVMFFAVFALCIESINAKMKQAVKYAVFIFFGILALFMSFVMSDLAENSHQKFWETLGSIRSSLGTGTIVMYIGALLILAVLLAVYFAYSHNIHQEFNDHVMNCQSSVFFSAIIYGVIQLGVLLLTVIVMLLLYKDAFDFILPVIILINGLFYVPAVICAVIKENEKAGKFYQALVRYVMLTISMLAYLIIYIYILKLVITRSVPSNSVYAILTALFCVSMFISYSCTTFEDKGFLQKFAYNSPIIFAPFILMQCYTVVVRIGQYGLTPKRYFGIAFIIFEIVYILYYTIEYRRDKEIVGRNLLLIVCVFAVITIFFPGINSRALSTSLARHRLASYIDKVAAKADISPEEYLRTNAAVGFLSDDDFGRDRLAKYFPAMDKDMTDSLRAKALEASKTLASSYRDPGEAEETSQNGWFSADLVELTATGSVDLGGYSELKYVNIKPSVTGSSNDETAVVDTSDLSVYVYDSSYSTNEDAGPAMTVDLSDFAGKFCQICSEQDANIIDYDEYRRRIIDISIIDINENVRLYITSADISRNSAGDPVRVDINGYMLVK